MTIQHLRSSTANKRPTPAAMSDGQLAVNTNTASPGLFFKDSAGALIKVGPVHVGTTAPNASPASGGETGNTVGEQWLDTTGGTYVFKVWDGSAWRSESGTFVDVNGDVMTGALGIIAGSAGSPGLYFSGDTNTGLYSPGADQVAISTNGTGRLFINSSGSVGIGTSTPSTLLEIKQDQDANTRLRISNATNGSSATAGIHLGPYGGNWYLEALASASFANPLRFAFEGTERFRFTSDGRLGIGTTSPTAALNVNTGGTDLAADFVGTSSPYIRVDNGTKKYIAQVTGSDFRIQDQTANAERLRIDSSGRLLIGTSNSAGTQLLKVNGSSSGSIFGGTMSLTQGRTPPNGSTLGVINFGSEVNPEGSSISANADGAWSAGTSHPSTLVFSTTADGASSPTERMRITNTGFLKASSTGGYYGATGEYHEFRTDKNLPIIYATNTNASGTIYGVQLYFAGQAPNNTASYFLNCEDTTAVRATIRSNGGLANYQANDVNLSDRNAKKDISPAAGTWDCIKEWEIVNYRYKDQPDDAGLNLGVIAQQVAESCPEVITVFQEATEDEPEKLGVKEQQMYWMAIKALQEAQVRIETLEAKVAAFESA